MSEVGLQGEMEYPKAPQSIKLSTGQRIPIKYLSDESIDKIVDNFREQLFHVKQRG